MVGLWTLRLGSYLVARVHKIGKDSRFDEVKHQPGMFFVYWSMQVCMREIGRASCRERVSSAV